MGGPGNINITLVGHAVVIGERLAVVSHRHSTGGEGHHAHALTRSASTTEQVGLVIEHVRHHRVDVGLVASLEDHVELLAKLLVDVRRLLEVRHLGHELVETDTGTRHRVSIERRSLQDDGKATGSLDPGELEAALLVVREELLARVRGFVLDQSLPVSSELRSLHKIKDSH